MNNAMIVLGNALHRVVPTLMAIDRERENKRRYDMQDARAAEEFGMRKQSHNAQMAATGLQVLRMQQEAEDDAKLREHLIAWRDNRGKIQQGDFSAFEAGLAEYNQNQGWGADGFTMKPRPTDDGKATILDRYDSSGKLIESSPPLTRGEVLKLYDMGMAEKMKWISPKRYDQAVTGLAKQQAEATKRAHEERIATGKNTTSLEVAKINQGGADRRHAGTLAVQRDRLEFDKTRPDGGLTLAQQRQNEEILAAREIVGGLSDDEIRKRTQQYQQSGRINDDFDPGLARQVSLANRRLIGDDEAFDARTGRQPAAQPATGGKPKGTPIERARAAMADDPNMDGLTLGDQVMGKGFKVYKDGKHVGYYGAGR
jgi:hypothetical protein